MFFGSVFRALNERLYNRVYLRFIFKDQIPKYYLYDYTYILHRDQGCIKIMVQYLGKFLIPFLIRFFMVSMVSIIGSS